MSYLNYGNRELFKNARSLRNSMTKAEKILWTRIRSKQIQGFKFRRQQPILNYIVDFYCDQLKLIIEVDGEIHNDKDIMTYDMKRDNDLKQHGFKIIRFSNYEVEADVNSFKGKIVLFIETAYPEFISEVPTTNEE